MNPLNEEITVAELEIYDTKIEELDPEAALNFAVGALSNAAAFWNQCSPEQKSRFQRGLFPEGLVFDGESYRTAPTCLAFSYLQEFSEGNSIWRPKGLDFEPDYFLAKGIGKPPQSAA